MSNPQTRRERFYAVYAMLDDLPTVLGVSRKGSGEACEAVGFRQKEEGS